MAKKETKARETWSVIADFASTFITTIIVIVAAVIVVIRLMGWNMYSVDSYSMTPTYPINSLVVVKTVEPETIQVGDVITYVFNEDGVLVTHRVTDIDYSNQTFTTKGDANDSEDASPVLWGNLVGKVVVGIPVLGSALRVLTAEGNRPIVIGVIVALLALSFGWDIVSGRLKKRKAKKAESPAEGGEGAGEAGLTGSKGQKGSGE
ncbi:MAG: signal peptidase I [Clostridiales bacterium]|nr:signal peptidase I [Clostridiales bacterium]